MHLILALLIKDGASEVLAYRPVRDAGHARPVPLWRLDVILKRTLFGTVLHTSMITGPGLVARLVT